MTTSNNDTISFKCCTNCGEKYPETTEYFYKRGKYRLTSWCKTCHNKRNLKNYHAKVADPEKRAEYNQRQLEHTRRWQANNPENIRENNRRWQSQNLDSHRARQHRRNAKKRLLPNTLTDQEWQQCLNWWGNGCAYCGVETSTLAREHFVALTMNGAYTSENIIPACGACNSSKGNKPARDWLANQHGEEQATEILARIDAYFEWVRAQ